MNIDYLIHEKFSLGDLMKDSPKGICNHHLKLDCCAIYYLLCAQIHSSPSLCPIQWGKVVTLHI